MKKIALLFTILCAGALNGMEQPEHGQYVGMKELPEKVRNLISSYTSIYAKLDDIINTIKSTKNKALHDTVNDIHKFTILVHALADRYNTTNTLMIAEKFNTPTSKNYTTLASNLLEAIRIYDIKKVIQLINQGADINFNTGGSDPITPLVYAILSQKKDMVKALLNSSPMLNLNHPNPKMGTILNYAQQIKASEDIQQLLINAMNKQ